MPQRSQAARSASIDEFAAANEGLRKPVFIRAGALAGLYAFVLFGVQRFWRDGVTYFNRCIEEFPDSTIYYRGLGDALAMRLDLIDAQREL